MLALVAAVRAPQSVRNVQARCLNSFFETLTRLLSSEAKK